MGGYIQIFLLILLFSVSTMARSVHGVFMVVKGNVEIQQKDKVTRARVGLKVRPGDTIVTRKDSRAKIIMVDKNIINISPDSRFVLEKYKYNPKKNEKDALLNVIYGKVRTTVNQKYDGAKNKFQVKTKSSVAGVRGTDFLVSFNQVTNTSKIVTFEGIVQVGQGLDKFGKIINPVAVMPGQFTVAAIGTPPSAAVTMPEIEIKNLNSQSVAESPKDGPSVPSEGKEKRRPSNQEPKKENSRQPDSVLNQMGEDVSAPIVDKENSLPPPIVPIGTAPMQPCPNGQCGLPPIDPTLLQGKTNVIIDLQPSP